MAASKDDDVKIVADESIEVDIKRQGIANAQLAMTLSVVVVGLYAIAGIAVLLVSFWSDRDAPQWATATVSSTVTAALALLFRDHLPGARKK